jgi:hypothetical protein
MPNKQAKPTRLPDPFDSILELLAEDALRLWQEKALTDDEYHRYLSHHRLARLKVRPPQIKPVENDETDGLEDQEAALSELMTLLAEEGNELARHRQRFESLQARYDEVRDDVKDRRRRRERINCLLSDGSRIYDMEAVTV